MNTTEPKLEDVLLDILDSRIADIHTSIPGRIESYDATKQTANVSIMIKRVDLTEDNTPKASSYPVLPNVPVLFPRGGGYFIHFPLVKGDFCYIMFSEAAIDQWRAKGQETYPGDLRRHGLTGAVVIPACYPKGEALDGTATGQDAIVAGAEGGTIDPVSLSSKVDDFIAKLDQVFRATITPTPGGGAALKAAYVAAFGTAPGSVGSEVLKVSE